jgi:endo-1,4-beta-xylanase
MLKDNTFKKGRYKQMRTRVKNKIIVILLFLSALSVHAQEKKDVAALPLKTLAARQGLLFGFATSGGKLNGPKLTAIAKREFNALTVEDEMKCAYLASRSDRYLFKTADYIIAWAEKNNMKVRGHTLIWHKSVPKWIAESGWNKEQTLAFLKKYITDVVTHFRGKLYAWDVVNEVFRDTDRLRTGVSSFWAGACGPEYIEKAFIWAHQADPDVKLFINDYNVERVNPKSTAIYKLVKELLAKGVPIHGFGMQAHMICKNMPNFESIAANIKRFTDLGLEVHITELDVRIPGVGTPEQFKLQAEIYAGFMKVAMENPGVTSVTIWGITDKDSWIQWSYPGYGAATLFDGQYNPKPAYEAVLKVLAAGRKKSAR